MTTTTTASLPLREQTVAESPSHLGEGVRASHHVDGTGLQRASALFRRLLEGLAIWIVAVVILAISGAVSWSMIEPQLQRPYVYDEAAFAFAGHAVASTGTPWSNLGHLQTLTPGDFSQRFNWALWHPPLYVYALGNAYAMFGETERTARLLGVMTGIVAALCIFVTATIVTAPVSRGAPAFAAAGTGLFVTNPFVIQSALMLDIDGTVLLAAIALAMLTYTLVLGNTRPSTSPITLLLTLLAMGAVALSLWAKMTTVLAVLVAGTAYRLVGRPWRPLRVLLEVPLIVCGGGAIFLATWSAFAEARGLPFAFPFRVIELEFAEAAGSTTVWRDNPLALLDLISQVGLWTSPYTLALFIGAGFVRLADIFAVPFQRNADEPNRSGLRDVGAGLLPIDFILISGAAIGTVYLIKLAGSFPKYHSTMMPFVAVAIAYVLARVVGRLSWWEPATYTVILCGLCGYFTLFVGDRHVLFRSYDWMIPLLAIPGVMGFAFLVLCTLLGRHNLLRQLAILGVLLTVGWSWGVNVTQAESAYSTAYHYGITGQREAGAYLDTILRPGERFVAAREVAYYAQEKGFIDQDVWWADIERRSRESIVTFDGRVIDLDVNILALFLWDPVLGRIAHAYLDDRYEVAFQSGVFVIFVRTG